MILLDAIYINNGGGKVLLDICIKEITSRNIPVFFLLDKRVEGLYPEIDPSSRLFLKASLVRRHLFYLKNKHRFSAVLSFGNLPPTVKLDCEVFTYFHNVLFIDPENGRKIKSRVIGFIKSSIIRLISMNTDYWIVQSSIVKEKLSLRWQIDLKNICIFPIFEDIKMSGNVKCHQNIVELPARLNFVYVSDGHAHKNHLKLVEAFAKYNQNFPLDSLTLTVNFDFIFLCSVIDAFRETGVNIVNKGFLPRNQVYKEYENADIFLYPSLKESFGLGLIEAAQYGLPVISADLAYVKEVIIPSAVFDPYSVDDIYEKLLDSRSYIDKPAKVVVQNKLPDLLDLLVSKNKFNAVKSY